MRNANSLGPEDYEIKNLIANSAFMESVNGLRSKWSIPKNGFQSNKLENVWREEHEEKLEELRADIKSLRKEFKLGIRWQTALHFYLFSNNPLMLRVQSPWRLNFTYEGTITDHNNVDDINLEVDGETTQAEVAEAQRAIKHLDKKPKKQLIVNADRDNQAFKMYQSGRSHQQIADWLNDRYVGSFNTDHVAKIIKRVQKRRAQGHPTSD